MELTEKQSDVITYEEIYLSLLEIGKRYADFTQFRVIGKSHDDRMIPMLEIGTGDAAVFCLGGLDGSRQLMPALLLEMARSYCQSYECNWKLQDFYQVRQLLDQIRVCIIPLLNPDGYEIVQKGYQAIHNPIHRQMLRMQRIPHREFATNARAVYLNRNFPTTYYKRKQPGEEPASENETKALISIFQEYKSRGLLSFCQSENKIVYYRQGNGIAYNQRSYHLARHLQKCSSYQLEKNQSSTGSMEQFYAEIVKQPALLVESLLKEEEKKERLPLLPLEYIYSLVE